MKHYNIEKLQCVETAVYYAQSRPNFKIIMFVSSPKEVAEILNSLEQAADPLIYSINLRRYNINFVNGSTILFKPKHQKEACRGLSFSMVIAPTELFADDVFSAACIPSLDYQDGILVKYES